MYLAKCNPVSIINKEPDSSSISLSITTGKPLVSAVKEHYVVALLCSSSCAWCVITRLVVSKRQQQHTGATVEATIKLQRKSCFARQ
jgi:hypothetical protein